MALRGVSQVHPKWIPEVHRLPPRLEAPGPDGSPIWADLDIMQMPSRELMGCLPSAEPVSRRFRATGHKSQVTRPKSRVARHESHAHKSQ